MRRSWGRETEMTRRETRDGWRGSQACPQPETGSSVWVDKTKYVCGRVVAVSVGVAGERPRFWSLWQQGFFQEGSGRSWRKLG